MGGINVPWFDSGWVPVTGVGTGVAYAAGDAVGGMLTITGMPLCGTLMSAQVLDRDAEGATNGALILHLFSAPFTATADNSPLNISDADMQAYWEVAVTIDSMYDVGTPNVFEEDGLNQMFRTDATVLYVQCQAPTGAVPNLATAPQIRLRGLILEP